MKDSIRRHLKSFLYATVASTFLSVLAVRVCYADDINFLPLPNELDPEEMMCGDGTTTSMTIWQIVPGYDEYQTNQKAAADLALAACKIGLGHFLRRLEDGGSPYPPLDGELTLPVTDYRKAGLGSRFTYKIDTGIYRFIATAEIVCTSCKLVYENIQKKFGCGTDPDRWSYQEILTHEDNWFWSLPDLTIATEEGTYLESYCVPLGSSKVCGVLLMHGSSVIFRVATDAWISSTGAP